MSRCFIDVGVAVIVIVLLVAGTIGFILLLDNSMWLPSSQNIVGVYDARIKMLCNLSIARLRSFLESQYVPEIGLLRASVTSYPDNVTVYIASDNLLASRALEVVNSSYASIVRKVLDERYGGGYDCLHEVLFGIPIDGIRTPLKIYIGRVYSRALHSYIDIVYEKRCGFPLLNWYDYADLVVYKALNDLLKGRKGEAYRLFLKLMSMWDGYGFRDASSSRGVYETYKLALAIYLFRALLAADIYNVTRFWSVISACCRIIHELQQSCGGIATQYIVKNGSVIPVGDPNTETTSIVILAVYSDYPIYVGRKALESRQSIEFVPCIYLAIPLMCVACIAIAMAMRRAKHRRNGSTPNA